MRRPQGLVSVEVRWTIQISSARSLLAATFTGSRVKVTPNFFECFCGVLRGEKHEL
jgi:hypothetical protein